MKMHRLITVCALTVALAASVAAAGQKFTKDNDPIDLGGKALSEGRLPKAKLRFEEAVASGHKVPQAYLGLAEIATREGRLVDAEAGYRRAVTAGNDRLADARSGLGVLLVRLGRGHEAEPELQRALELDDDNWAAHYGLARLHLAAGKWDLARAELDHGRGCRGVREGEDRYHYGLALLRLGTGDAAGAEPEAVAALQLNPTDTEFGALVGRIYEQQGKPGVAIQVYESALAAQGMPRTAPLLHQLGNLYRIDQRFDEARDRYLQAVGIDSTYTPVLRDLGNLLGYSGRHELAARTYLRYVAAVPADTLAWVALSASLFELHRYDQARDAAAKARQLDPASEPALLAHLRASIRANDPDIRQQAAAEVVALPAEVHLETASLLALAAWQVQQQQYDAAEATLARADAADPDARIPLQRGVVALRAGRPEAAVAWFQDTLVRDPSSAPARQNLGVALYQAGRTAEAVTTLRDLVARDPEATAARLILAQALAASGSSREAAAEFHEVLEREPGNAQALRGYGYATIRLAEYSNAVTAYRGAVGVDPNSADGWAGLGTAYLGTEDLDAARQAFSRARQIDPSNVMLKNGSELLQKIQRARKETAQ
jgi:tetratricopeptide (TPR) repeat protein